LKFFFNLFGFIFQHQQIPNPSLLNLILPRLSGPGLPFPLFSPNFFKSNTHPPRKKGLSPSIVERQGVSFNTCLVIQQRSLPCHSLLQSGNCFSRLGTWNGPSGEIFSLKNRQFAYF